MNWTPDVLYSGYGPTRPPNHGNQGQGTKSKRSGNFSGTSGQPAGTNRSRPSSSNFSGSNRPNNSNPYHKGQGKQSQGLKSGNDRFSNAGNSGQSEAPICFAFNQYEQAFCELPNNQCNHKRLHKCQTCGRWGCKSCNHSQQSRPTGRLQANVTLLHAIMKTLMGLFLKLQVQPTILLWAHLVKMSCSKCLIITCNP